MKTVELKRSIIDLYAVTIALVVAALALWGCGGPQASVKPVTAASQPANTQLPAQVPIGSLPNSSLFGIPTAAANALMGRYSGTLFKMSADGTVLQQSYVANLYSATLSGYTSPFAALNFQSNGPIGNLTFSSYLNVGLAGFPANGVSAYGFSTSAQEVPQLLDLPFTVHLVLSLNNGVFSSDPTHSAIFIKECGFSQGAACSNFAQDVWFGSDLRKQSP